MCDNCYQNCGGNIISDQCVKYTGEDIACLGICKGDTLYMFEEAVANKLCEFANGEGINLSDVDITCQFLVDTLGGKDKTLTNILQMLIDASCTLRTLIETINTTIGTPYVFDTKCLTVLDNPSRDDILQATINKLCDINTTVSSISTTYVTSAELCDKIDDCLNGGDVSQEWRKFSPYIAYDYFGPLDVFDVNGNGLQPSGYDKIYMCIGQTIRGFTLPDCRGRSTIMANTGILNTDLDTDVDPSLTSISLSAYPYFTKTGEYKHALSISELPNHTIDVEDQGHYHYTLSDNITHENSNDNQVNTSLDHLYSNKGNVDDTASQNYIITGGEDLPTVGKSSQGYANLVSSSIGSDEKHNTLHPVITCVKIMYIP